MLRSLNCITGDGRIVINGEATGEDVFTFTGAGDSVYTISSGTGDIVIYLY